MVAATSWFDEGMADRLSRCYRQEADAAANAANVLRFRHNCRILPTREEELDLGFHCRRVRGEIFFVATGQGDGSHVFSKTLAEHEAALRQYLIRYRQQNSGKG